MVLVVSFAAIVIASPFAKCHERGEHALQAWRKYDRLDVAAILSISIVLKQSNLDQIHDHLMDVSHPASARFGKESVEVATT